MRVNQASPVVAAAFLLASSWAFSCKGTESEGPATSPLKLLWFAPATFSRGWPGQPVVSDGVVILGAHYGIAAFDEQTGQLLWRAKLWSREWDSGSKNIVTGDGRACMADQLTVGCVEIATGRVLWSYDPTPAALASGETVYDRNTWFYGGPDHKVHAVDPSNGTERWSTDITPGARYSSRIFGVSLQGDTVYATTVRWITATGVPVVGDLVALNRDTGRIYWTYTTPGMRGGFQGRALLTDKLAIVNDAYAHSLLGIDRQTGTEVWRTTKDDSGFLSSETTPVLVGDTVFAASADTQIYAVDARTGGLLWRVPGDGDALGGIDACPHTLIALEFAGGRPVLVDRKTHRVMPPGGLSPENSISSRFAVSGNRAYAAGTGGVYAFECD
jgi:outer membrane protein assembly factor BamB